VDGRCWCWLKSVFVLVFLRLMKDKTPRNPQVAVSVCCGVFELFAVQSSARAILTGTCSWSKPAAAAMPPGHESMLLDLRALLFSAHQDMKALGRWRQRCDVALTVHSARTLLQVRMPSLIRAV
jgi:hypothetical protein